LPFPSLLPIPVSVKVTIRSLCTPYKEVFISYIYVNHQWVFCAWSKDPCFYICFKYHQSDNISISFKAKETTLLIFIILKEYIFLIIFYFRKFWYSMRYFSYVF
jgi:hypothetical protein